MKKNRNIISLLLVLSLVVTIIPSKSMAAAGKIKLNKSKVTIYTGKSTTLKVIGTSKKIKWKSGNKKIAIVSSKGKVTAKKKGNVKIIAKIGKKKYTCKVTVKSPYINTKSKQLYISDTFQLKVIGTTIKSAKSSNNSIATVTPKGKVTALKEGSSTITLTGKNKKSYTCNITVIAKQEENTPTDKKPIDTRVDLEKARTWIYDDASLYNADGSIKCNEGLTRYLEEKFSRSKLHEAIQNVIATYKIHGYSYVGSETDISNLSEETLKKKGTVYFKLELTDPTLLAELEKAMLDAYVEKGNVLPEGEEYTALVKKAQDTIKDFSSLGIQISTIPWQDSCSIWIYGEFRFNGDNFVRFTENMEWAPRWLEYNNEDKVWFVPE